MLCPMSGDDTPQTQGHTGIAEMHLPLITCESPYFSCGTNVKINLDGDTIDYFKMQSETSGIPYQTFINLYLSDCATQNRKLEMQWK